MTIRYSRIANECVALKSQDVLVALKLLLEEEERPYAALADELRMSASEVHAAVGRLREGRLVTPKDRGIVRRAFRDFLISGIAHVFPAREGEPARGVPTAWAAPVLESVFKPTEGTAPVWPHPQGKSRGPSVTPIYKSAPEAALRDSALYELLALVDALRLGRARERKAAVEILDKRIFGHG